MFFLVAFFVFHLKKRLSVFYILVSHGELRHHCAHPEYTPPMVW